MLNVYLAGKMDEKQGGWRDGLLGREYIGHHGWMQRWELYLGPIPDSHDIDGPPPPPWPMKPNTWVLNIHNYVGPYRTTVDDALKNKGDFHGTEWVGQHGWMDPAICNHIVSSCLIAIRRADVVFAYLNAPDCFGTLVEIGYARALGKFVYVAVDDDAEWHGSDYWFADLLASGERRGTEEESAIREEKDPGLRVRRHFLEALAQYTAEPPRSNPVQLVQTARNELADSFTNIAKWTSDPRVRGEAQRMLKRLGQSA